MPSSTERAHLARTLYLRSCARAAVAPRAPMTNTSTMALSDDEQAHLENVLYPQALAAAAEPDSPRNREIAASDYWLFLQSGGGSDDDAVAALVRGLKPDATAPPDTGPSVPWGATPGKAGLDRPT